MALNEVLQKAQDQPEKLSEATKKMIEVLKFKANTGIYLDMLAAQEAKKGNHLTIHKTDVLYVISIADASGNILHTAQDIDFDEVAKELFKKTSITLK